jgi:hypothetical protein
MKTVICALVGAAAMMCGGCSMFFSSGFATPAYSGHERGQLIARDQNYEWRQAQDDIDHVLLLRPASSLTIWNVR